MFPSTNFNEIFIYNQNPNPNSIQEQEKEKEKENPPLFSHFPSPFLDDDHSDLFPSQLHQHQHQQPPTPTSPKKMRKTRKDRHSKIFTSQGLRARRMRLPLQIARRFFDLQDLLGFDKASKTIEWLFAKSKKAIKELTKNIPNMNEKAKCGSFSDSYEGEKNKRELGKARELRDKARARARERTREKMMMRRVEKMVQLGSSSSNPNSPIEASSSHQLLNKQFAKAVINGNLENSIFDYGEINDGVLGGLDCNNNNLLGSLGNWDVENEMINWELTWFH